MIDKAKTNNQGKKSNYKKKLSLNDSLHFKHLKSSLIN